MCAAGNRAHSVPSFSLQYDRYLPSNLQSTPQRALKLSGTRPDFCCAKYTMMQIALATAEDLCSPLVAVGTCAGSQMLR